MLKNKRFLLFIIFAIALFLIPSMCNAANTFATEDGIKATKIVENSDGTIDFKFENIVLSAEGQYSWAIDTTSIASEVKKWNTLGDFNESKKTAILTVTPSISSMKTILRTTNTAWLYIRDEKNHTYIVDALKVDLTLPALKAFNIAKSGWYDPGVLGNPAWEISRTYDFKNFYYKIEKITDNRVIQQYENCNGDLSKVEFASLEEAPETGWETCIHTDCVPNRAIPTEEGLYYLWVKGKDTDSKTIIGYSIINYDDLGPTVESIFVVSPTSGTYNTSQTVKIRVYFSEKITGTSVPTLKVRFGDSEERSLQNGTIYSDYVEYSYNIQAGDKGQLATVDLKGGTLKDAAGNTANLSCPLISGNTIKANVEGTNNNQTENLDKENNTPSTTVTLSAIAITKTPTRNTYLEGEKFDKAGMVITATYSDGSKKEITNYSINLTEELKTTDEKVIIAYTENNVTTTAEQEITVLPIGNATITLTEIKITKAPTKTKYTEGEKFDKGGMVITATYSDGTTKTITNYSVSTSGALKTTDKKVTITYTENRVTKTVEQTISVAKDSTTKGDNKLPQTGATLLSLVLVALIVVAAISKLKYGKYKNI